MLPPFENELDGDEKILRAASVYLKELASKRLGGEEDDLRKRMDNLGRSVADLMTVLEREESSLKNKREWGNIASSLLGSRSFSVRSTSSSK